MIGDHVRNMTRRRTPWGKPLDESTVFRMSRVGSRDTRPELRLRSILHSRGHRFRVDLAPEHSLRRRADIVFTKARVAVFVDGCFWHGCPDHVTWPRNNSDLWRAKIERTRVRDQETTERLVAAGWSVVRVWEHENPEAAAARVERALVGVHGFQNREVLRSGGDRPSTSDNVGRARTIEGPDGDETPIVLRR